MLERERGRLGGVLDRERHFLELDLALRERERGLLMGVASGRLRDGDLGRRASRAGERPLAGASLTVLPRPLPLPTADWDFKVSRAAENFPKKLPSPR
jgi:hypothetical protein